MKDKKEALEKRFFSIKEASKFSSLSERFLYQKCANREIRFSRVGKRIIINIRDLENYLEQNIVECVDWSERVGELR